MNRQEMAQILDSAMSTGRAHFESTGRRPFKRNAVKTYLIEANAPDVGERRGAVTDFFTSRDIPIRVDAVETDDDTIHLLYIGKQRAAFYLDTIDPRYWVMHTLSDASGADRAVKGLVTQTRLLDSFWFPTHQFVNWSRMVGIPRQMTAKFSVQTGLYQDELADAEGLLDNSLVLKIGASGDATARWRWFESQPAMAPSMALSSTRISRRESDSELWALDDVTSSGKVTARGNSFLIHEELILGLKHRYSELLQQWEGRFRLGWASQSGGVRPFGETALIRFPDPLSVDDLEALLDRMFDSGEPYRLYALPTAQGSGHYVARGVDLHTGDKIDFEITSDFLRAYLSPTACGNVLTRLLTNLQHFLDARVYLDETGE